MTCSIHGMGNRDHWPQVVASYLQTKSIRKTALEVGLSRTGVEYVLKATGTPRFPQQRPGDESSSRKAIPEDMSDPRWIVRDFAAMHRMYVEMGMSLPKIAKALGVSQGMVRTGMDQCGIPRRSRSEALKGVPRPGSRGTKHRDWKGGITHWRKQCRSLLNPVFVRPVMERDNFKCRWCPSKKSLVVHHIRPFCMIVRKVISEFPGFEIEDLVDAIVADHTLEDGITLCKTCHDQYHKTHGK